MPSYDLLAKASAFSVLAIFLGYLLYNYIDSNNKEKAARAKERKSYEELVSSIRQESREREKESQKREDRLMKALDRYNDSLESISENIKAIPQMKNDIAYLKEKVK